MVDPGEDGRVGDALVRNHRAGIFKVSVGLDEADGGAAGVPYVRSGQGQQAHAPRLAWRVLDDQTGELRQMLGLLRRGGHRRAAFLEEDPDDLPAPDTGSASA